MSKISIFWSYAHKVCIFFASYLCSSCNCRMQNFEIQQLTASSRLWGQLQYCGLDHSGSDISYTCLSTAESS